MDTRLRGYGITAGWGDGPDAVRNVGMEVRSGKIVCVVGPNGAGKSTLLAVLGGVLAPRAGRVELNGLDIHQMPAMRRARRIGYLPQSVNPTVAYTVRELVGLGRYPHLHGLGFETAQDRASMHRAMELAGVVNLERRPFSEISGGERQRVLIASVLAQEPKVLLLDEPTAALDIGQRSAVFQTLKDLAAQGAAVGVVTHDLNLAGLFADEIILMADKEVLVRGEPREVIGRANLEQAYGRGFELISRSNSDVPGVLPALIGEME